MSNKWKIRKFIHKIALEKLFGFDKVFEGHEDKTAFGVALSKKKK